jgi:hypothetical protein
MRLLQDPRFRRLAALLVCSSVACDLDSSQAVRIPVPVVVDGSGMVDFTNDEGYAIRMTTMRVAFDNVEFTTSGEMHASLLNRLGDLVIPTAYAHPGHYGGGQVIGEMNGRFVVDWLQDGGALGDATMLEGSYDGANFVFTRARAGDGTAVDDPIIGHTMEIAGEATRDGTTWTFHGFIDQDEGRRVVGLPLALELREGDDVELGLQALMIDPFEGDTALDHLDFAALDADGDGRVELLTGDAGYNTLVKQLQVHDQYEVTIR